MCPRSHAKGIAASGYSMVNADDWRIQPWGPAAKGMKEFDGDLTVPSHAIRYSLKFALVRWHQTHDPEAVRQHVREETAAYGKVYTRARRLSGLRDDFEMHLAMAVAITNDRGLAKSLRKSFNFKPCANGYAYYAGFKQALLALLLDDKSLATRAITKLESFNATKTFYFPSKAVIFAALQGDMKKLSKAVQSISKKFDGYAKKKNALNGDTIDVGALDNHWYSPYPDWAFFVQAIRRFGPIDAAGTFWMPVELLTALAGG